MSDMSDRDPNAGVMRPDEAEAYLKSFRPPPKPRPARNLAREIHLILARLEQEGLTS